MDFGLKIARNILGHPEYLILYQNISQATDLTQQIYYVFVGVPEFSLTEKRLICVMCNFSL